MRIQNTSLIGLFLQEMGRLWRVSDCDELVGESKVSESSPEIFESISDIC